MQRCVHCPLTTGAHVKLITRSLSLSALALSGLVVATPALNLNLMKVTVVTRDGVRSDVLSPAEKVNPGDILLQRATLSTDRALKGGHIVVPVPRNTHFLAGSATTFKDLTLEYSADGGKTYSVRPMKTVTVTEDGKSVTRQVAVPANEYTTVRWTVNTLAAGSDVTVDYRVAVD